MLTTQTEALDYRAVNREQRLHIHQQMLKIRVFEEHVNELYSRGQGGSMHIADQDTSNNIYTSKRLG